MSELDMAAGIALAAVGAVKFFIGALISYPDLWILGGSLLAAGLTVIGASVLL